VAVTPWWEAVKIRPEIISSSGAIDDVQMSLFQAVHGTGSSAPLYSQPSYYGEITYPSSQLVDLLAKVAVRLGSDNYTAAPALRRLDQGMGGGKSHACIGSWHLGTNPADLAKTEIGKKVFEAAGEIAGKPLPHDLGNPHVVVLACDNMTPGAPDKHLDGPATSLFERFLWRLFSHDYAMYERYQPFFSDKNKIAEALKALNRPVLIIVDEVLDYIGNGLDGAAQPDLTGRDMAFLRALLDTVNDVPHVAMVVVMIASEKDALALSKDGERRREELHADIERNGGQPTTVNENADFSAILRRRLFVQPPAFEVTQATASEYRAAMRDKAWQAKVYDPLAPAASWVSRFQEEVARTYPFHPQLMHLAEKEWANLAGYQKVRSTIRVFAATVYALSKRAEAGEWTPRLIGPGDLPLSDAQVRENILGSGLISDTKTQANYRSIAQSDIVALDDVNGAARQLDLKRDDPLLGDANPRAAERAATMTFLASVVGSTRCLRARAQGGDGRAQPLLRAGPCRQRAQGTHRVRCRNGHHRDPAWQGRPAASLLPVDHTDPGDPGARGTQHDHGGRARRGHRSAGW
jgi:predicted AAA+ superfamily ATPase